MTMQPVSAICRGDTLKYFCRVAVPTIRWMSVLLYAFLLFFLLSSCKKTVSREELAVKMAEQEIAGFITETDSKRVAELESDIRKAERRAGQSLKAVRDKGTYWRLLGLKYMDYQMWAEALNAFDEALKIYPDFAGIQYHRALCAAKTAQASPNARQRQKMLDEAEFGYRKALAEDRRHTQSMYALAVLLVFELQRSSEAVVLLENYLSIERSSIPARFLLARVYLEEGHIQSALELYEQIQEKAQSPEDRHKAANLYQQVMEGNYGS